MIRDKMKMYAGDQFRLSFMVNHDCYVYVLNTGPDGTVNVPCSNQQIAIDNRCKAGEWYIIPDGNNWYTLDAKSGKETLFLIASDGPMDDERFPHFLGIPRKTGYPCDIPIQETLFIA